MAKGKKQDVRRPRRAPELGGIYGFQMYEGTFGACQVLSIDGPRVELATLDVLQDRPVATTDLDGVKVARRLFHGEAPRPARCVVDADVPWWATHLVTRAPVEVFDDPCNAFGGGWMVAFDRYFQARRGRSDRPRWQHDPTDVDIDLGGGRRPVRRDIRRLSLGDGGDLPRAKGAPGHFDALEALPYLDELSYAGPGAGFAELVRRRAISRVTWRAHEQTEIDLSSPHLDEIVIEVTAPLHLVVSPSLLSLHVEGDPAWLTVSGASVAFPFELGLRSGLGVAPKGLEAVTRLHVSGVRDGDARALTTFTALRDLIVAGKPGKLRHPEALAALSELRTLWFLQLYDLDADAWPGADAFPHVERLHFSGLRSSDAATLKARFARAPTLKVTGVRSDDWIAQNLDNPFRDWDEDGPKVGKPAVLAWKKAHAAATALEAGDGDGDAETILRALVTALNRIPHLDTLRREQAADAFFALARRLGVCDEAMSKWFDAWRDF